MFTSIISFFFVIFVIVLFHEFGHFIVAKLSGIKVNEFSIGFGPKIFSVKHGETEYVIRPIPLGGFVDLYGMEEEVMKEDDKEWDKSFVSKPAYKRFATLIAGPFMNYVLAFIVIFTISVSVGQLNPIMVDVPALVVAEDISVDESGNGIKSFAYKNNLRTGDVVLSVNGEKVEKWSDLKTLMTGKKTSLKLEILRNHNKIVSILPVNSINSLEKSGIYQGTAPILGEITPGQEASKVKMEKNDRIVEIENIDILIWEHAADIIHASVNKAITVKVKREDKEVVFNVTPQDLLGNGIGILGISPKVEFGEPMGALRAVSYSLESLRRLTEMMFGMISKLVTGSVSVKHLTGPVGIASVIGEKAREGITWLFYMLAFISINIGFLNLLPFPALDGGRLLFILIEMIGSVFTKRKFKVNSKIEEMIHYAGLVFLIFLILIITYRDILRLFKIGG